LVRDQQITEAVKDLTKPFNASRAGDLAFRIRIDDPTGPRNVRRLALADRMALECAHRVAAMERAGFPAADITKVRDVYASYATAA
jgi:hypothetical protein